MGALARHLPARLLTGLLLIALLLPAFGVRAQYPAPRFDRAQLDAMLAPIALYPDTLLSHVLMAATYPEEIAEAAAWLRARPGLSGDAAVRAAADQDWDPAVRSLLAFPQVLETLANYPRWTADLGDAFLAQREDVMDTIQALRRRAYEAGTLRSNEAIRVTVSGAGIVIEQAHPETVYVPYYEPQAVYGGWWWPSRPPMHWPRWPGYVARDHFFWGPAIHVSSGFFFGSFVWPRREVHIVHVHSHYYPRRFVERRHVPGRRDPVIVHREARPGVWRHDEWRRRDRHAHERDRHEWRRDDDRRWRTQEPREGRRHFDRDGDGRPDRRFADRNRDGIPDVNRRRPEIDRSVAGRDAEAFTERRGSVRDRNGAGVPDRRYGTDMRRGRDDDHQRWRTHRSERDDARARVPRAAPRQLDRGGGSDLRVQRPQPPRESPRESRPAPRARVDPSNRD